MTSALRVSRDLVSQKPKQTIDLVRAELDRLEESRVRLNHIKKIETRDEKEATLVGDQLEKHRKIKRRHFENQHAIRRWRERTKRHLTVHQLDSKERERIARQGEDLNLLLMTQDLAAKELRTRKLYEEYKKKIAGGTPTTIPVEKIKKLEEWLAHVPAMFQTHGETFSSLHGVDTKNLLPSPEENNTPLRRIKLKTIVLRYNFS